MATTLAKGANAGLPGSSCRITLMSAATGIDVSAVLLREDGKVRSDSDLVFFNHPAQDGVVLDKQTVAVELGAVPDEVRTVAVVASIDPELAATHFDAGSTPRALVECGAVRLEFVPPPFAHRETVAVLIELYRRGEGWKARAVGQGWDTGLAGLASDFGIAVDDPGPSPVPVEPGEAEAEAEAETEATAPSPLGAISLAKSGHATISLRKDDADLTVTAALEWNGGSAERRESGADLDLYALFVPRDGVTPPGKRAKKSAGAVYYRRLGSPAEPPFIALDGDSTVPGRETVTIRRPDRQGYVLICAYSAVENGPGSFTSYGARAVVTDGRGSTVTVPLFSSRNLAYWVAIALIDFTAPDGVTIRHVEKYSADHVEARPTLYSDGTFRMGNGKVEFKTR